MPIYAYKCGSCGHAKDVLQKLSDPALTTCPSCGADSFTKQITAAGFQLKGSGWYATDFRGGNSGAPATPDSTDKPPAESKPGESKPAETKPAESKPAESKSDSTPAAGKTDAPSASAGGCDASCACH
jgi:putative FmdB family regulatory protein